MFQDSSSYEWALKTALKMEVDVRNIFYIGICDIVLQNYIKLIFIICLGNVSGNIDYMSSWNIEKICEYNFV